MIIEPVVVQYGLIFLASFCAYMIGRLYERHSENVIIESTIQYLIDNGFLRSYTTEDGDIEIKKLNE